MNMFSASTQHSICQPGTDQPCLTCSDEAIPAQIIRVEETSGIACVAIGDQMEEVDITLVEDVVPGDIILVHGGVALARLKKEETDVR